MQEGKTIGQLMEEMRQKAGAQNYHGHDYMDLQRFAENTRHREYPTLRSQTPLSRSLRKSPGNMVWIMR